ncbi:MAG: 2-oxo-4-hydroxy-4-carboxy-5-ureidoimidazoline decarboxylase [Candidatus Didemnitutus sp.]|nr:2-oxo-4-hydroxy-4-carboxy-5-ureidoimidazoline decarboxylase [Candidatus Didemnitutus sp.]
MPTTLTALNQANDEAFVAAVGHLFEHSPWVARETLGKRPFRDAAHLHAELCATMRAASRERQMALIAAHPNLAGRLAQQNQLTADSTREQAGAGLGRLTADELATFQTMNTAYRTRFGFPFIICARLNAKEAILEAMRSRLSHPTGQEFETALGEIEKIAWLRLSDAVMV